MRRIFYQHKNEELNGEFQVDMKKLTESALILKKSSETAAKAVINITYQLKERLRDTVYRFFAVIDAIDDLVCIKDSEGNWKTLNAFGQSFYKLTKEDYFGKTSENIADDFPAIRESLISCSETDNLAWVENRSVRNTQQFLIDDIEYFFDIIKTPVYTFDGKPKELVIIGRDITNQILEAQKNQACLRALNSASDAIALLDKNKKIIFFNNSFMIYFPKIENQKFISDIYRSIDEQYEINKWNELAERKVWCQELTCIIDNKPVICEEEIIHIMNGNSIPIHYICLLRFSK